MLAASSASSLSFSSSFICDGGLYHHPQQQQLYSRLSVDQATAASSSVPCEGCLLHHRLDVASSLSFFPTVSTNAAYGDLYLLRQHRHIRHGFASQATTHAHVHCLSLSGKGAGCGAHHYSQRIRSVQAATLVLSASQSLQQEKSHICLTLSLNFAHPIGVGNGVGYLQNQKGSHCLQAHSQQHLSLQEEQERLLQRQQKREIIKKLEADILESIVAHQESLKNSALTLSNAQIELNATGYVPPQLDTNTCRSVFVGNVHRKVTANFLEQIFSTVGTLVACKLVRKRKASYGIVEYLDHRAAAVAIATLNGRQLFNLPIKVNWAYSKELKEDKTSQHTIFVGDLSAEITDAELFTCFDAYPSRSDVRIMWDQRTGQSKGFGFVSFRDNKDAEKAIEEMTGKILGDRAIRCDWAVENKNDSEDKVPTVKMGPKNDPRCSTVYIGKLPDEVTEDELRKEFDMLGAGAIEEVLISEEKNFGFVRYRTHEEAALALSSAKGKIFEGKPVTCSWGRKRNPAVVPSESRPLAAPLLSAEDVIPLEDEKTEEVVGIAGVNLQVDT